MEKVVYLDTHVVVWLYSNKLSFFSPQVLKIIEHHPLRISPMVLLEIEYLYECGKIKVKSALILKELSQTIGLKVEKSAFEDIIYEAIDLSWTKDPFDRMIVAQAKHAQAALITKDEQIQQHYKKAVW